MDTQNDVAIIKVDAVTTPLPVQTTEGLHLGEELFTIGFPAADIMGVNCKLTRGHLNALSGSSGSGRRRAPAEKKPATWNDVAKALAAEIDKLPN
jgi:G:T/U-mismatch repair DNA glycosylase